jgi:hypothetical protein
MRDTDVTGAGIEVAGSEVGFRGVLRQPRIPTGKRQRRVTKIRKVTVDHLPGSV